MWHNTSDRELQARDDVLRAVLATPSTSQGQIVGEGLRLPQGAGWPEVFDEGSLGLTVCRVTRSLDDILAILRLIDLGVPIVLVDRRNESQAARAIATLDGTHEFGAGEIRRLRPPRSEPVHRDRRLVLPTSGSSGDPKYVSMSADSLIANAGAVAEALGLTDDDIGVTTLSPAYSYGLSNVLAHMAVGATMLCVEESITSERLWKAAGRAGVTSLAFAASSATVVLAALRRSLIPPTLRRIMFAGGGVKAGLIPVLYREAARLGVSVHLMYGQTEAGPRIAISGPNLDPADWGTVGTGIGGVRTRVVDSAGAEQAAGREGRIQVAGRYLMAGYVRAAGELASPRTGIDWLDTGDRGRRDVGGRLWITGRADDQRKVSGYRIDLGSVRGEAEDVFGCPSMVIAGKQTLTVCLETTEHFSHHHELVVLLARRVSLPVELIHVFPAGEFPRGPSGKVDRRRLEEIAGVEVHGNWDGD